MCEQKARATDAYVIQFIEWVEHPQKTSGCL